MSITAAQARRAVRRAELDWDEKVKDPRAGWNQRHDHHGLLSLMVAAFACGRVALRRVEDLCGDLGAHARRRLGVPKQVSDSTLYRVLAKQGPAGLRETVRKQVQKFFDAKLVRRDLFRIGVASFDGKTVFSSTSHTVEGAKESVDSTTGAVTSTLSTLRAVLTSALGQPALDLELIAAKTGESPAFRKVFHRVVENFGSHFEVVTADSGMTGRENALVIRSAGKHFVLALKGNQPTLFELAQLCFAAQAWPCLHQSQEREHGGVMTRLLHVIDVRGLPEFDFFGAAEVWRVTQWWTHPDGRNTHEVRYFLSSMPPDMLSAAEKLALIRLHWGIENGHHWTLDVALEEDDRQPVQTTRDAIEVVAWLRMLGYNLLALWRAKAPRKDGKPISWARAMEVLRDALLLANSSAKELLAPIA